MSYLDEDSSDKFLLRQLISSVLIDDAENVIHLLETFEKDDDFEISAPYSSTSLFRSKVLNSISESGETIGHIVVYKNSSNLLSILLKYGLHPHAKNINGDTILHLVIKFGAYNLLHLLYESNLCNLNILNDNNQTPLEVVNEPITDSFLFQYLQFRKWNEEVDKKINYKEVILQDRLKCFNYLKEKLKLDKEKMDDRIFNSITSYNRDKNKIASIIQGYSSTSTNSSSTASIYSAPSITSSFLSSVTPSIHFNSSLGNSMYADSAKELFLKNKEAVENTARLIFIDEYVSNIVSNSIRNTTSN